MKTVENKMITHDELINLGKQIQMKENTEKKEKEKYIETKIILTKICREKFQTDYILKNKAENEWVFVDIHYYAKSNVDFHLEIMKEFIQMTDDIDNKQKTLIESLKEELKELKEEKLESDKEYEELSSKFTKSELYWKKRVIKLREKCIRKNNIIKFIYFFWMFVISQSLIIYQLGIHEYFNIQYFILYFFAHIIYYTVYIPLWGLYNIKDMLSYVGYNLLKM